MTALSRPHHHRRCAAMCCDVHALALLRPGPHTTYMPTDYRQYSEAGTRTFVVRETYIHPSPPGGDQASILSMPTFAVPLARLDHSSARNILPWGAQVCAVLNTVNSRGASGPRNPDLDVLHHLVPPPRLQSPSTSLSPNPTTDRTTHSPADQHWRPADHHRLASPPWTASKPAAAAPRPPPPSSLFLVRRCLDQELTRREQDGGDRARASTALTSLALRLSLSVSHPLSPSRVGIESSQRPPSLSIPLRPSPPLCISSLSSSL
ncbi:hypothetical protein CDD83_3665 [Cordyceps sp. RAO-2017]|nr:hypothetical protein CDD83_3665 [Cordyceps sp. RAO-2017]